jgi:hypothetical protein
LGDLGGIDEKNELIEVPLFVFLNKNPSNSDFYYSIRNMWYNNGFGL